MTSRGREATDGHGRPRPQAERSWAVVSLWASGHDTAQDRLLRLLAMRRDEQGHWLTLDRLINHGSGPDPLEAERLRQSFGLGTGDYEGAVERDAAWFELRELLAGATVLTLDGARFRAWYEHEEGQSGSAPTTLGLLELASLLCPGRLANRGESLVGLLLEHEPDPPAALYPPEIAAAMRELVERFLGQEEVARALVRTAWRRAAEGWRESEPAAARTLALAQDLIADREAWYSAAGELVRRPPTRVRAALPELEDDSEGEALLDLLTPLAARLIESWNGWRPLENVQEPTPPFLPEDTVVLDQVFEQHLPRLFAGGRPAEAAGSYRASQHAVAREVARALAGDELLLVHAPTGTGKTLAYLVPALLWARSSGVRVGVATYTRALQEQAMERDVPLALRALAAAGREPGWRVCVLKGRENYLCWRAFRTSWPSNDDPPENWLAWAGLLLFALSDAEGDLDRWPYRPPIALASEASYRKAAEGLVANVRARTGCCSLAADRESCAAELARRRAERCHVVLTNHAFALHRTEFFRHIVFDECEHLHDQAMSAWSHKLPLRSLKALLASLHRTGQAHSRALLDRLQRSLLEQSPAWLRVQAALDACVACDGALRVLVAAVRSYEGWRVRAEEERHERERHALLREYAESPAGRPLLVARAGTLQAANALEAALAEIGERLDSMPVRGIAKLRRSLELLRNEWIEWIGALQSWLPTEEGEPALRRETFYDVDLDPQGEVVLHARVLLPNAYLASNYYPVLKSGIFLSATTWLRESFEGALGYLGLDRTPFAAAEGPAALRPVACFRAPEVFDYTRVLVAVPRDAPSPASASKAAHLRYVRDFLAWLGERTRGRILALFTNQEDVVATGRDLAGFFRARRIPFLFQGMPGVGKEELSELFREQIDSILLGVDTFWYGADFPGETLEYLVLVRLPYGVPDRYHHAQCATLGTGEHRKSIYMPRALAKFRQGFGRLMRRHGDRGVVFVLDPRILDPRHRIFQGELPLARAAAEEGAAPSGARLVRGTTEECLRAALEHMQLCEQVHRQGLSLSFGDEAPPALPGLSLEELPF